MAALIDGLHVRGLDQTGLSQKGGPVVSDLRISRERARVGEQGAGRQRGPLPRLRPARRRRRLEPRHAPTRDAHRRGRLHQRRADRADGDRHRASASRSSSGQLDRIDAVTRRELNLYLDAQALSERLFGDHMMANTLALGAAFQRGAAAGVGAGARAGDPPQRRRGREEPRRLRLGPRRGGRARTPSRPPPREPEPVRARARARPSASASSSTLAGATATRGELRRLVEIRVPELVATRSAAYARRYAEVVRRVQVAEQERAPGHGELTEAVARNLFKLMAYKDEYEVARLHLDAFERAKLRRRVRRGRARSSSTCTRRCCARWARSASSSSAAGSCPPSGCCARMRRLRGTPLDPFGLARGAPRRARARRRVRGAGRRGARRCSRRTRTPRRVELCELPDLVRGYEEIKLESVDAVSASAREAAALRASSAAVVTPAPQIAPAGDARRRYARTA